MRGDESTDFKMQPLVSVIIPLFNKEEYIAEAIRSVLAQTFTDYEIIIVNDGSTDGSVAALAPFRDKVILIEQQNRGPSVARNRGIEVSKGEYIAFLDADDRWFPGKLQHQVAFLEENPEIGWCGTAWLIENADSNRAPRSSVMSRGHDGGPEAEWTVLENWFEARLENNNTWTSVVLICRGVFETTGCFDEGLPAGQDMDLWIRIALKYPVYGYLNKPMAVALVHTPGCVSLLGERKYRSMLGYIRKHLALLGTPEGDVAGFEAFLRWRLTTVIRACIGMGFPAVAREALELFPASWRSGSQIEMYRLLSLLPAPILRVAGAWRRALFGRMTAEGKPQRELK